MGRTCPLPPRDPGRLGVDDGDDTVEKGGGAYADAVRVVFELLRPFVGFCI